MTTDHLFKILNGEVALREAMQLFGYDEKTIATRVKAAEENETALLEMTRSYKRYCYSQLVQSKEIDPVEKPIEGWLP